MRFSDKEMNQIMKLDDETIAKLEKLAQDANIRDLNVYVRQPKKKIETVAGFPFSLIERLLQALLDVTARGAEGLVRRIERRFAKKRQ